MCCCVVFNAYILWWKYKKYEDGHVTALQVLQEDPEKRPTRFAAQHWCSQRLRDEHRKVGRASCRRAFRYGWQRVLKEERTCFLEWLAAETRNAVLQSGIMDELPKQYPSAAALFQWFNVTDGGWKLATCTEKRTYSW